MSVPLSCLLSILVNSCCLFAIGLLFDPGLVKTDDALLKFFIVRDVLYHLEHVVFKSLFLQFLHVKLVSRVQVFIFETLVAHLEIIDNQVKVGTYGLEVLYFDLHPVDLVVELSDVCFSWQYVSLELFDLVVEHEFELLKLLSLLFELDDPDVFLFNCAFS